MAWTAWGSEIDAGVPRFGLGSRVLHSPYELLTKFRLGGEPIGDCIGFWGGPIKGYATNLV